MFEKILSFSIQRRQLLVLLTLGMALLGLDSLWRLPIDAVPDITNNQVVINSICPGLDPEEVEKQVTFPLETNLAGLPGLLSTRSLSRNEFGQITAIFADKVDTYFARQLVQERLQGVRDQLPSGVSPTLGPVSTGLGEVVMWSLALEHPEKSLRTPSGRLLEDKAERLMYLRELQEWYLRPRLREVDGVADVDSIGGYRRQYLVEVDAQRLARHGLSISEVVRRLEQSNQNVGAGLLEVDGQSLTVRVPGRLRQPSDIEQVVLRERTGSVLRLQDVAQVKPGRELRAGSASENGHEVVIGTAYMRIGGNSRLVAQGVSEQLTELGSGLPPGIRLEVVLNRMDLVDATVSTVKRNLLEGALLVTAVLFGILGNLRAALIVATAIPLSMLFTAIGMNALGVSGNLMSLGAIDFGLIVDGSVIIVENSLRVLSERQLQLGRSLTQEERLEAVYAASCNVRNATAFGEAIIILVYVPILFLTGVEGKMYQPMAMTVMLALTSAFVLSLSFIPALVALGLTGSLVERENPLLKLLQKSYLKALQTSQRRSWTCLMLSCLSLLGAGLLVGRLGQVFKPSLDEKNLAMHAVRVLGTGVERATALQTQVESLILELPEVQRVFSKTGTADLAADPMPPNVSDTFIILKPSSQWPDPALSKAALIKKIEAKVRLMPGHEYEFTQPIEMRFNELISGVRSDVAVKIFGDSFEELNGQAVQVAKILQSIPGSADVRVEPLKGLPTLLIEPRRLDCGRLGVGLDALQAEVQGALRGQPGGWIFEGDRRFELVVRLPENQRQDPNQLANLPIPLADGDFVSLHQVADVGLSSGLNQVSRERGKRRITVQCNVRGRDLAGFVEQAQATVAQKVSWKNGVYASWGGQYENLQEAKKRLQVVVPICLLLILLALYATFRSLGLALLVFVGVPLALPGGVLALWLTGLPFSISAAVGFIALSGVAVLNGLVLVSFIEDLRSQGMDLDSAVLQGCRLRFRPVLMTALVATLGFLPMAMSAGTGAEVQRPVAVVVIGGLLTTTPLILFVLPALYGRFRPIDPPKS